MIMIVMIIMIIMTIMTIKMMMAIPDDVGPTPQLDAY
jgi:hypothetical protein